MPKCQRAAKKLRMLSVGVLALQPLVEGIAQVSSADEEQGQWKGRDRQLGKR